MKMNRIKKACKTNSMQAMTVSVLTLMNIYALWLTPNKPVPLRAWVIMILLWPVLAFIGNLMDPL